MKSTPDEKEAPSRQEVICTKRMVASLPFGKEDREEI